MADNKRHYVAQRVSREPEIAAHYIFNGRVSNNAWSRIHLNVRDIITTVELSVQFSTKSETREQGILNGR